MLGRRKLYNIFSYNNYNNKINLSLSLTKYHTMKMYRGSEDTSPRILNLCTRWRWSALRSGSFTPEERAPSTHWTGGWLDHRTGMNVVVNRLNPSAIIIIIIIQIIIIIIIITTTITTTTTLSAIKEF
jgi:hypothetical protein